MGHEGACRSVSWSPFSMRKLLVRIRKLVARILRITTITSQRCNYLLGALPVPETTFARSLFRRFVSTGSVRPTLTLFESKFSYLLGSVVVVNMIFDSMCGSAHITTSEISNAYQWIMNECAEIQYPFKVKCPLFVSTVDSTAHQPTRSIRTSNSELGLTRSFVVYNHLVVRSAWVPTRALEVHNSVS